MPKINKFYFNDKLVPKKNALNLENDKLERLLNTFILMKMFSLPIYKI